MCDSREAGGNISRETHSIAKVEQIWAEKYQRQKIDYSRLRECFFFFFFKAKELQFQAWGN